MAAPNVMHGGWWVHLRAARPAATSVLRRFPLAHATAHWRQTGHPIIQSFEPGEDWFWNYETNDYYDGPNLPHRLPSGTRRSPVPAVECHATGRSAQSAT